MSWLLWAIVLVLFVLVLCIEIRSLDRAIAKQSEQEDPSDEE